MWLVSCEPRPANRRETIGGTPSRKLAVARSTPTWLEHEDPDTDAEWDPIYGKHMHRPRLLLTGREGPAEGFDLRRRALYVGWRVPQPAPTPVWWNRQ
jgi:hypothetical protein